MNIKIQSGTEVSIYTGIPNVIGIHIHISLHGPLRRTFIFTAMLKSAFTFTDGCTTTSSIHKSLEVDSFTRVHIRSSLTVSIRLRTHSHFPVGIDIHSGSLASVHIRVPIHSHIAIGISTHIQKSTPVHIHTRVHRNMNISLLISNDTKIDTTPTLTSRTFLLRLRAAPSEIIEQTEHARNATKSIPATPQHFSEDSFTPVASSHASNSSSLCPPRSLSPK
jgi:hypothetical protein